MWVCAAVLLLCLRLATSAPTIDGGPDSNALSDSDPLTATDLDDFGGLLAGNDTFAEEVNDDALTNLWNDLLKDYDAAGNMSDALSSNVSQSAVPMHDIFASENGVALEDAASSEESPSSEAPTSTPTTTTESIAVPQDHASAEEAPSSSDVSSSSSSSSSAAEEEDEYDYYDYSDAYGDYAAPTAFPFNMFDDLQPRPPVTGDVLPSSCAWAVVQCCDNPDKMGSRVSCFTHVGCYGSWFQDFCTPELKKVVFKSVFKSFNFSP